MSKRHLHPFLLIVLIANCLVHHGYSQESNDPSYQNLTAEEFYIEMNRAPEKMIIDVRLFSEYRKERITGAILASKREELVKIVDSLDRDMHLFVYCDDGQRSTTVCKILAHEKNFINVYNLEKGLYMWKKVGLPMDEEKIKVSLWKKLFDK
jgi:rhodanese-related sulfurtransferase